MENSFGGLMPEERGTVIGELKVTDKLYILTDIDLMEEYYLDKYIFYLNSNSQ